MEDRPDIRKEVVAFLQLVCSEERQESADLGVDPEEVPAALCRYWFDDVYLLNEQCLETIPAETFDQAVSQFRKSFNEDELEALARFHCFLELRLKMLPEGADAMKSLPKSRVWQQIMQDAQDALEIFREK